MALMRSASLVLLLVVWLSNTVKAEERKNNFVNIEHGWPLPDDQTTGGEQPNVDNEDLQMQMPACRTLGGVCALTTDCRQDYIHEATDLCGDQAKVSCCLTKTFNEKRIIPMQSCAKEGGVCAWDDDCPKSDRHPHVLLCGAQDDVSCCRTQDIVAKRAMSQQYTRSKFVEDNTVERKRSPPSLERPSRPSIASFRTLNVGKRESEDNNNNIVLRDMDVEQDDSCLATGGRCQRNNDCSPGERGGPTSLCKQQPDVSCCSELPPHKTGCRGRGGECIAPQECEAVREDKMGDCPANLVCCVWTRGGLLK